ncbi:DUF6691 family protein [Lysobacter xanthus]
MKPTIPAALASGALFGLGLAMSGMADPRRVMAFLDVFGAFDPRLLAVLGGAVATTALLFPRILRRPRPVFAPRFALPSTARIDRRLLLGAALFGIGWGLAGYCPGPALAGLAVGNRDAWIFVAAMAAGMLLHRPFEPVETPGCDCASS